LRYNDRMRERWFIVGAAPLLLVVTLLSAAPDEPAPLWPDDLRAIADKAPPAIAAILRDLADPADDAASGRSFEQRVLEQVDVLLKSEDAAAGAWAAEKALRACLRFSLSQRHSLNSGDRWPALQQEVSVRLLDVRRRLLQLLAQGPDLQEALSWAEVWLPLYGAESRLGNEVRTLWVRHAEQRLKAAELEAARRQLTRIDETFAQSAEAEPLGKEMRGRAEALVLQSRDLPDVKAIPPLHQAQTLWPRLPGLRDELEKRKGTYQVLYVAGRDLPEYLSPALAYSDAERQALRLIFEGLVHQRYDAKLGPQHGPQLAESLTVGTGVRRSMALRRDVYWSDGERFTAADVRHTAELLAKLYTVEAAPWRELIETPRLDGNLFRVQLVYRQGLLDPWTPLCARMLPQHAHGRALTRADDAEFAAKPIGTGPYMLQGREGADGRVSVVLRANPQFVRHGAASPGALREIRWFAWTDPDAAPGVPLPHLVLDPLPGQLAALKKAGYTDLRSLPLPRTWFLAVNHRRAALANVQVRLALAQAIDRRGLLDRHFRAELPDVVPETVNGPFPRGSWANSPAQRVPEELYRPEDARACARKAGKDMDKAEWTLKYPAGDPRLDAAFKDLAQHVSQILAAAEVHVIIRPVPLPPRQLQTAVRERDFDLVYEHLDTPEQPEFLGALFDPQPDAVSAGGSNYLGYDQDAKLQALVRSALHHREFKTARDFMQGIHARLFAEMPLIPLWRLPYPVAVRSNLRAPDLDALAIFGNVLEWKLTQ
jgi:ABC-type transport system substrate-binding protein